MPKVFISRDLTPESSFKRLLEEEGLEVHGESLIQIDPVSFTELPETDWIFFYSKNAVDNYFKGLQNPDFWKGKKLKQGPPRTTPAIKYAAYGSATAAYLRKNYQIEAQFIGSAQPKSTAEALVVRAAGERILFPRARHSLHTLYKYLRYKADVMEVVVYDNYKRSNFEIPHCEILVFTSPMNAQAYYDKYPIDSKQKVIAIGYTTSAAIKKLGVKKVAIAKKPAEQSLAEMVLQSI